MCHHPLWGCPVPSQLYMVASLNEAVIKAQHRKNAFGAELWPPTEPAAVYYPQNCL